MTPIHTSSPRGAQPTLRTCAVNRAHLAKSTAATALGTMLVSLLLSGTSALAAGCQGQNATSDAGGRSAELTIRIQEELVEKAKNGAGLATIPAYVGGSAALARQEHDGYKLRTPVPQVDCLGLTIAPINQLLPFETRTFSASALSEFDLTKRLGYPPSYLIKFGAAVGMKSLESRYKGRVFTPSTFDPNVGVNVGNGSVDESGIQFDFYSLIAQGSTYAVLASSFGFGDSDITNPTFNGLRFGAGGAQIPTRFGGGLGKTDYQDYAFSATLGHVFTIGMHAGGRVLFDVSGGLLYSNYDRDGFTDTTGIRFSDAETSEFSGKIDLKLGMEMKYGASMLTPFVKAGIKHRFDYQSTVSVFNPTTGLCAVATGCDFTARYDLKSDDTFWRIGGGVGAAFGGGLHTGVIEVMYQGSGDSSEVTGKAQMIFKVN